MKNNIINLLSSYKTLVDSNLSGSESADMEVFESILIELSKTPDNAFCETSKLYQNIDQSNQYLMF